MTKSFSPLVVFGFDAALPELLIQGGMDGSLPTMHSLMKEGEWGMIRGREMLFEHGLWLSLMSGISRKDHGYFYFRQMAPGSYELKTMTGKDAGVNPFWARFQGSSVRVAIFDIPDVFPVPGLSGIQLSDVAVHNPNYRPQAYPADAMNEVNRVFGRRLRFTEIIDSTIEQDRNVYQQLMDQVKRKGRMIRHFLSQGSFHLVICIFSESHAATHQFWKYFLKGNEEFRHDPRDEMQHAILDIYRAIDEEFGRIRAMLPDNANTFVLSSCGMQGQYPCTELMESFCTTLGYRVLKKAQARPARGLDILRKLIPEKMRIEISKRILTREQREAMLSDQFKSYTDWTQTRAFATPSIYNGFIRVNLKGREPQGIVDPSDYKSVLQEIEKDLMLLTDDVSGESIVQTVVRTGELFETGPHPHLPDLIVKWKAIPRLLRKVRHPRCTLTQSRPEFYRGSDHTEEGFYVARGPMVTGHGKMPDACVLDFVPRFVRAMSQESAPAMRLAPHGER